MPGGVQRVGDQNTAGGVIVEGNPTVLINGRPVAVVGSKVTPHPCCGAQGCPPTHCAAVTTSTNATVLVGGLPIVLNGDIDTCGHPRIGGSLSVIVGL
jgi:uncharacterized Zn-binding protein involved in type VI secretion